MSNHAPGRRRLNRETIIDALIERARESRAAEVSFRDLGAALEVDATAIYRHFRDKDELFRAAVDRLYAEALSDVDAAALTWRERLLALAERLADVFLDAPAIGQLAPLIDGRGTGELASMEFILEALDEAGLAGAAAREAYAAFAGHTLAFAAGMARESVSNDADAMWVKTLTTQVLRDFPRVDHAKADLLTLGTREVYRAGVNAILDAIEYRTRA